MKKASYKLGKELRIKVYQKILSLPIGYGTQRTSGEMVSRIVNDILLLESTVGDISRTLFLETVTVLILIGVAFNRSWQLTLLTFIVFPLVVITSEWLARKTHKNRHRVQNQIALNTNTLTESFKGLKEIKVYLVENRKIKYFAHLCEKTYRFLLKSV